jgi:hypothetical protein
MIDYINYSFIYFNINYNYLITDYFLIPFITLFISTRSTFTELNSLTFLEASFKRLLGTF